VEGPDRRVHQWPVVIGGVDLPTSEVRSTQELTIVGGVSVILKSARLLHNCTCELRQLNRSLPDLQEAVLPMMSPKRPDIVFLLETYFPSFLPPCFLGTAWWQEE